jgi:DNA-binding LacI/PurR family transcriptional regulator
LQCELQTLLDSPAGGAGVNRQSGENHTITARNVRKSGGFSPATISIVLNNAPPSSLSAPFLTTVRQALEAMGSLAVNFVMKGVNAGLKKRDWNISRRKMDSELVIRDSRLAEALSGPDD